MNDISIAIIGDEPGVEEAYNCIKYKQIVKRCLVWSDEIFFYEAKDFLGKYDILILAFKFQNCFLDEAYRYAVDIMRHNVYSVLNFYAIKDISGPRMLADRVMQNTANVDGIILGISHAEIGIIPPRLGKGNFINLAISTQDIWSNCKIMNYCINEYREKLKHLKYVFFDMYDYSYFNYDDSRTNNFPGYLYNGGYRLEAHNFDQNKHFDLKFEELIKFIEQKHYDSLSVEQVELWNMIGSIELADCDTKPFLYRKICLRNKVVTKDDIEEFYIGRFAQKIYTDTINENISIFNKMLKELYELNPDISILLVTMPRYIGVKNKEQPMIEKWKDEFYTILEQCRKEHNFKYIDFTGDEMSNNPLLYFDAAHFNSYGAMFFTDLISDKL